MSQSRSHARPARIAACAVLLAVLLPGAAHAVQYTAARKLGRGLAGMTTSFLEIPGNMVRETRRHGPVQGYTLGFVKGLGGIVVRTLVGVYETVTSPFEVPKGFVPIIEPEFTWDYFDPPAQRRR